MSESFSTAMARRVRVLCALALAIVTTAACGDELVDPPTAELTADEAEALFLAANTLVFDSTTLISHNPPGTIVAKCPQGGQAKLVFTVKDDGNNKLTLNWTVTPTACKNSSGKMTFTMDGDPSARTDMIIHVLSQDCPGKDDFCTLLKADYNGDLKWQLEERTGTCAIKDVKLDAYVDASDPDDVKIVGTVKGSACGHQIEVDASKLVVPVQT